VKIKINLYIKNFLKKKKFDDDLKIVVYHYKKIFLKIFKRILKIKILIFFD
jgi:hypothetical protein